MRTKLFNALKVSALALLLSFGLSFVYAWTAPTANPPAGNVSAPINTSATAQTKAGNFNVQSLFTTASTSIGTTASTQLLTVAGDIGATGDVCTALGGGRCLSTAQLRVIGTCTGGKAITAIANDGAVTCGSSAGSGTQTFTSAGDYMIPSGVTSITVKVQGSGGGGGGGMSSGGGGGGGYSVGTFTVVSGTQYHATIGSGGPGGLASGCMGGACYFGTAGTVTSFGPLSGSPLISCAGGHGGNFDYVNPPTGGAGGICTGGQTNTPGFNGATGNAWNISTLAGSGGAGGNSGGGVGAGAGGAGGHYAPTGGQNYGGGGGGGYYYNAGGTGAQGRVVVEW